MQLLCCQYAEKQEAELNNVDGRKRKRKKIAKLREQDDDFGTEKEHREDLPIIGKKTKTKKKDPMGRSTIMAKNKGKKDAPDKVIQLERAKIMAQQVIAVMPSTDSSENLSDEENSIVSFIAIPSRLYSSHLGDPHTHSRQAQNTPCYLITELNPFKKVELKVKICSSSTCSARHQASVEKLGKIPII